MFDDIVMKMWPKHVYYLIKTGGEMSSHRAVKYAILYSRDDEMKVSTSKDFAGWVVPDWIEWLRN